LPRIKPDAGDWASRHGDADCGRRIRSQIWRQPDHPRCRAYFVSSAAAFTDAVIGFLTQR
jgi:hypothetical protein